MRLWQCTENEKILLTAWLALIPDEMPITNKPPLHYTRALGELAREFVGLGPRRKLKEPRGVRVFHEVRAAERYGA